MRHRLESYRTDLIPRRGRNRLTPGRAKRSKIFAATLVLAVTVVWSVTAIAQEGEYVDSEAPATCTFFLLNTAVTYTDGGEVLLPDINFPVGPFRLRVQCDIDDPETGFRTVTFASQFIFPQEAVLIDEEGTETIGTIIYLEEGLELTPVEGEIASLELAAPTSMLNTAGTSTQVTLTATMSDGSTEDRTSSDSGTVYRSSNPAIVSISAEGMVDAVASGTAFITATNEEVTASTQIDVVLGEDDDNDGLPNDYELLNQVDPGGNNLALLPSVTVSASSYNLGGTIPDQYLPANVVDGDTRTVWKSDSSASDHAETGSYVELIFPDDQSISAIHIIGDSMSGFDVRSGILTGFDVNDNQLFNSGTISGTWSANGIGHNFFYSIDSAGVRRVRFTPEADSVYGTSAISEFRVLSKAGPAGLDPENGPDALQDFDGDGLNNLEEFMNGTSVFMLDTDGDGLLDSEEIDIGSNPVSADSDGDGLSDQHEVDRALDTDLDGLINILDPDSDDDGLSDGIEDALGLSPVLTDTDANGQSDAAEDSDLDTLANLEEVLENLDPTNPDTDDDGLNDAVEINLGTDPRVADSTAPAVAVTHPDASASLVQGGTAVFALNVSDDGLVVDVDGYRDDAYIAFAQVGTSSDVIEIEVPIPTDLSSTDIRFHVFDTNGNETIAGPMTYNVVPDPGTTVVGLVRDMNGMAAAGATVYPKNYPGQMAVTAQDGTFNIPDIPASNGRVTLVAERTSPLPVQKGVSSGTLVNVGEITDIGTIAMSPTEMAEFFVEFQSDPVLQGVGDLGFSAITYSPDASGQYYSVCREPAVEFPTPTDGGIELDLALDDYAEVVLADGKTFPFYGVDYTSVYVGSNGYVTFGQGDFASDPLTMFELPRVAAVMGYLEPTADTTIGTEQFTDRLVVSVLFNENLTGSKSNSYQIELYFDGTVVVTYLNVSSSSFVAGLSAGQGMPASLTEIDLSAAEGCGTGQRTTISGVLQRADGTAVESPFVQVLFEGSSGVSGSDGSFSIPDVRADLGPLTVVAGLFEEGTLGGNSDALTPVAGGITDAGIIVMAPLCDSRPANCTDSDGDCVPDDDEFLLGLDANQVDSDSDNLIDGLEDADGDTLNNCTEIFYNYSPDLRDTDGDELDDAVEFVYRTNPAVADTDADGLSDFVEIIGGTDPLTPNK